MSWGKKKKRVKSCLLLFYFGAYWGHFEVTAALLASW